MFRLTTHRRALHGTSARQHYEDNYQETLKMRKLVYTENGWPNPIGFAKYCWSKANYTIVGVVSIAVGLVLYHHLVNYATGKYTQKNLRLFDEREAWLRSTGKVKSEKHIVKQVRQIEDPDAEKIPCFTTHEDDEDDRMISRAFLDDDATFSPVFSENKYTN